MAADLVIIVAAVAAAYFLRYQLLAGVISPQETEPSFRAQAIPLVVAAPLMMLAMLWAGQYRPRRDQRFHLEAVAIIKGTVVGLVAIIVVLSLLRKVYFDGRQYGGWQFVIYGLTAAFMLLAWRLSFRIVLRFIRAQGWNLRHVAIIGTGRLGQLVYHTLRRNSWTGIQPAFFISHHQTTSRRQCR